VCTIGAFRYGDGQFCTLETMVLVTQTIRQPGGLANFAAFSSIRQLKKAISSTAPGLTVVSLLSPQLQSIDFFSGHSTIPTFLYILPPSYLYSGWCTSRKNCRISFSFRQRHQSSGPFSRCCLLCSSLPNQVRKRVLAPMAWFVGRRPATISVSVITEEKNVCAYSTRPTQAT